MAKKTKSVGRPSAYDPKFVDEILNYFNAEPYREITKRVITKKGDVIEIPEVVANDFPNFAGFARKIGRNRDTLLEWCKVHQEFAEAYALCKDLQENWLLVNGLKKYIDASFGIFTLKNVAGFRDKQPGEEDKVTVTNQIQVQAIDLEERIKQLKGKKE